MFQNKRLLFVAALAVFAAIATAPVRADDPKPGEPEKLTDETRGYLGYAPGLIEGLTVEQRSERHIERVHGIYVEAVTMGMPAQKAGLEANDVLVSVNGVAVPDTSKVDAKDRESVSKYFKGDWAKIVYTVKPGDTVTIVVDRQGKTESIKAVAVTKDEMEKLVDIAQRDANAEKIPDWKPAGTPNALSWSFEGIDEGKLIPEDLFSVTGYWELGEELDATPANHVLRQVASVTSPWELAIVKGTGHAYPDATVTVRWKPQGGEKSVSGGIAFRAQTWKNFYVAIADGVSKTLSIVHVKEGVSKVLASKPFPSPKLKTWHTLEVKFVGSKFSATADGGPAVEAEDGTLANGWAGMCVAEDADTSFDDWKATPAAK